MSEPSSPHPHPPPIAAEGPAPGIRTRVLCVGVDVGLVPALLWWLPAASLHVEFADDLLHAIGRLLGETWDLVLASVGAETESDLRAWFETLEQARGHPRFIALAEKPSSAWPASAGGGTLAEMEALHIRRTLEQAGGCVAAAARLLGIHRNTLARKLRALGIRNGRWEGAAAVSTMPVM